MIENYVKIAWRNLVRNKGSAFTNIIGLTIGMVCTIFIFLWVKDKLSFNKLLILMLVVVSLNTISAALANPVKSLRVE